MKLKIIFMLFQFQVKEKFFQMGLINLVHKNNQHFINIIKIAVVVSKVNKPLLFFNHGQARNAAASLLSHASHTISYYKSKYYYDWLDLQITPNCGGTYFLSRCPQKIGYYLSLTGQSIDDQQAGYLNQSYASTKLKNYQLKQICKQITNDQIQFVPPKAKPQRTLIMNILDHQEQVQKLRKLTIKQNIRRVNNVDNKENISLALAENHYRERKILHANYKKGELNRFNTKQDFIVNHFLHKELYLFGLLGEYISYKKRCIQIQPYFYGNTLQQVIMDLKKSNQTKPRRIYQKLISKNYHLAKLIFEMIKKAQKLNFVQCLEMEYNVALSLLHLKQKGQQLKQYIPLQKLNKPHLEFPLKHQAKPNSLIPIKQYYLNFPDSVLGYLNEYPCHNLSKERHQEQVRSFLFKKKIDPRISYLRPSFLRQYFCRMHLLDNMIDRISLEFSNESKSYQKLQSIINQRINYIVEQKKQVLQDIISKTINIVIQQRKTNFENKFLKLAKSKVLAKMIKPIHQAIFQYALKIEPKSHAPQLNRLVFFQQYQQPYKILFQNTKCLNVSNMNEKYVNIKVNKKKIQRELQRLKDQNKSMEIKYERYLIQSERIQYIRKKRKQQEFQLFFKTRCFFKNKYYGFYKIKGNELQYFKQDLKNQGLQINQLITQQNEDKVYWNLVQTKTYDYMLKKIIQQIQLIMQQQKNLSLYFNKQKQKQQNLNKIDQQNLENELQIKIPKEYKQQLNKILKDIYQKRLKYIGKHKNEQQSFNKLDQFLYQNEKKSINSLIKEDVKFIFSYFAIKFLLKIYLESYKNQKLLNHIQYFQLIFFQNRSQVKLLESKLLDLMLRIKQYAHNINKNDSLQYKILENAQTTLHCIENENFIPKLNFKRQQIQGFINQGHMDLLQKNLFQFPYALVENQILQNQKNTKIQRIPNPNLNAMGSQLDKIVQQIVCTSDMLIPQQIKRQKQVSQQLIKYLECMNPYIHPEEWFKLKLKQIINSIFECRQKVQKNVSRSQLKLYDMNLVKILEVDSIKVIMKEMLIIDMEMISQMSYDDEKESKNEIQLIKTNLNMIIRELRVKTRNPIAWKILDNFITCFKFSTNYTESKNEFFLSTVERLLIETRRKPPKLTKQDGKFALQQIIIIRYLNKTPIYDQNLQQEQKKNEPNNKEDIRRGIQGLIQIKNDQGKEWAYQQMKLFLQNTKI